LIGDQAVLLRADLERLVELARRSEEVELLTHQDDLPNAGIRWLCQEGRAFDWLAEEEDLYTVHDLRVHYR
jgi:hypothetical protein